MFGLFTFYYYMISPVLILLFFMSVTQLASKYKKRNDYLEKAQLCMRICS